MSVAFFKCSTKVLFFFNFLAQQPPVVAMTILRMRIACWITKATDKRSEYVTLIAFPWQQLLGESASMLRYTYIAFLL
jgi:hypothetical protein